jgi:hypothetical protein
MFEAVKRWSAGAFVAAAFFVCSAPNDAHAQYKNRSFGVWADVGFIVPNANPTFYRELYAQGSTGVPPKGNPFSLINPMLHFEFNQKVSMESWFLKVGFTLGLSPSTIQDLSTSFDGVYARGGAVLWLEGSFAPRYFFLTDNIRPFIEAGLRMSFLMYTTDSGKVIPDAFKYMPGVYAGLGIEFIVARDIALGFMARYSLMIPVNYNFMHLIDAMVGINFYI